MRFVAVKTVEQQSLLSRHRARGLLVRQRTQLINGLRGLVAEFGVYIPRGLARVIGLAFAGAVILWTEGTRLIPSAQSALLGTVEIPCATLLAWIILNELSPVVVILGGTVIMSVVLWHTALDYWQEKCCDLQ